MKLNREYSLKEIADLYHCTLSSDVDYKFNSISSINKIENHSLIYQNLNYIYTLKNSRID